MDDFVVKFTNLLWYVMYIKEEKAKVQGFFNSLLALYKERIEFDNPNPMDEDVRKVRLCYQQFKNRSEGLKPWKIKDKTKSVTNIKGQKQPYHKNFGKDHQRKKFGKGNVNQHA